MISEISHENSGRPKRVHTETTETEIFVRFTETKPKLPKQNSEHIYCTVIHISKIDPL